MEIGVNKGLGYGVINYINLHEAENIVKSLNLTFEFDYFGRERSQFLCIKKILTRE